MFHNIRNSAVKSPQIHAEAIFSIQLLKKKLNKIYANGTVVKVAIILDHVP